MDEFILKSFTEGLVEIVRDPHPSLKLKIFVLSIWKKATCNVLLMKKNMKAARAIANCCLYLPEDQHQGLTNMVDQDHVKDVDFYRFKILQNLASDQIRFIGTYDFDKYQITKLIINNLNHRSCKPPDLKRLMDLFKISNLDINRREFAGLFEAAQTNAAFNFLWISFWIGAEVSSSSLGMAQ